MSEVIYLSRSRVERVKGPVRLAYLPAEREPVTFGVHAEVAEHYKVPAGMFEPHATTLDYVVAAAAGWLCGTFGGALEARRISAEGGRLVAEAYGDVEKDDGVLVIRRILVKMLLKASSDQKETIERVFGLFADRCPIYRTLRPAIEFRLELELLPED